tara:strand:+ start:357 stop:641 length:285 start_codon:yes stop_codon:yes gene_type:complete
MSDQQSISKIDNDDINNELKDKIVNILGDWMVCVNQSDALTDDEKEFMMYHVKNNIDKIIFDETDHSKNDIDTNSKRLVKEKFAILKQKFKNSL